MKYYHVDRTTVLANTDFRRVVYTGPHLQAVLMSVPSGLEIGEEVHSKHDQAIVLVVGEGKATVGGEKFAIHPGDVIIVPAGQYHNLKNLGPGDLKLVSFFTPTHYPLSLIHPTRDDAARDQENLPSST